MSPGAKQTLEAWPARLFDSTTALADKMKLLLFNGYTVARVIEPLFEEQLSRLL